MEEDRVGSSCWYLEHDSESGRTRWLQARLLAWSRASGVTENGLETWPVAVLELEANGLVSVVKPETLSFKVPDNPVRVGRSVGKSLTNDVLLMAAQLRETKRGLNSSMRPVFSETEVKLPNHDADLVIRFPGGRQICIQARPSNACEYYNGSLDILLDSNQTITCWSGNSMQPAEECPNTAPHCRFGKQIVLELPGRYPDHDVQKAAQP